MKRRVFGVVVLLFAATVALPAQNDCPPASPVRLISNLTPVLGQSPLWIAAGGRPLSWKGPNVPVKLLVVRDVAATGPAFLAGTAAKGTTGKVTFSRALYGLPTDRLPLDALGEKLENIRDADIKKYAFYWVYIHFSAPGCYEIGGRVGRQQPSVFLRLEETS